MKARVIAIDGPSGVGKSTLAHKLAQRLNWQYLDTGGMYRCIALAWLNQGSDPELLKDQTWLASQDITLDGDRFLLNQIDVTDAIRRPDVTRHTSLISAVAEVRNHLTEQQRAFATTQACVLDGRDIGTIVFPNAFLKIYVTASPQTRARRRWLEQVKTDPNSSLSSILEDQIERDQKDMSRAIAPLRKADDALEIATDDLSIEQVLEIALNEANKRLKSLDSLEALT